MPPVRLKPAAPRSRVKHSFVVVMVGILTKHAGYFFMLMLSSADFFQNYIFFTNNSFRNSIKVSKYLDPDRGRWSVIPGLGPNCLQK